jgi:opacity protein-like surface antigen
MHRTILVSAYTSALVVSLGMPAGAAPAESGLKIAANVGASMGDGHTSAAAGGAIGYRFTRNVGFDVEVSYTPSLEFDGAGGFPLGMPGVQPGHVTSMSFGPDGLPIGAAEQTFYPTISERTSGTMLTFLASFVGEIPTGVSWLCPYVLVGAGSATVTEKYGVGQFVGQAGMAGPMGHIGVSQTSLAITAGGGVDFPIWKRLAVGVDARYIHVAREGSPLNTVRAGTRISYRF